MNPWSIDSVADGIYTAIQMPAGDRHLRHEKHWRYISQHTVGYWSQVRCPPLQAKGSRPPGRWPPPQTALETDTVSSDQFRPALSSNVAAAADGPCAVCAAQSFTSDLQKFTRDHGKMKCYGLGLGLNTFKMVALTEHFRKLELPHLLNAYSRCVGLFPAGMCLSLRIWCMRSATMLAGASVNKLHEPAHHRAGATCKRQEPKMPSHGCGPATHAGPTGSCP